MMTYLMAGTLSKGVARLKTETTSLKVKNPFQE